jgi:hypothetical protein
VIPESTLRTIAKARLADAKALLKAGRYDGAIYLGGYAVELALKSRICKTLGWTEFPETRSEFQNYQSFKIHDLDVLLHLSGRETRIKTKHFAEWSAVATWNPEARYKSIGTANQSEATNMLAAVVVLLKKL